MLLKELQDDHGFIRVYEENDQYRFLEFGARIEQSCVYMPDPAWLEYEYTRAMLMGALAHHCPKTALFLGLGAGTLSTACLKFLPIEHATAIELRPVVIELAKEYLALPKHPNLKIKIGNAQQLIKDQESSDLIFVDLYTDSGPSEAHKTISFLQACYTKLNPNGWLIINQWTAHDGKPLEAPIFDECFNNHYWQCSVESGNTIIYIPQNKAQQLDLSFLKQQINQLESQLGYSLLSLYKKIIYSTR